MSRKSVVSVVSSERIERRILLVRELKVLLDSDLAELYGVSTKRFNEQVRRNRSRFPADFMFRLTAAEFSALRSHYATSKLGRGGRRHRPFAFTEHGALIAATVLKSPVAVTVSIEIVRVFVRLRALLSSHADLARKRLALEQKVDSRFRIVFETIRRLMSEPPHEARKGRIGFLPPSRTE